MSLATIDDIEKHLKIQLTQVRNPAPKSDIKATNISSDHQNRLAKSSSGARTKYVINYNNNSNK